MIATHNTILKSFLFHKNYDGALKYWNLLQLNRIDDFFSNHNNTIDQYHSLFDKSHDDKSHKSIDIDTILDKCQLSDNRNDASTMSLYAKPNPVTISIMIKVADELDNIDLIKSLYEMANTNEEIVVSYFIIFTYSNALIRWINIYILIFSQFIPREK